MVLWIKVLGTVNGTVLSNEISSVEGLPEGLTLCIEDVLLIGFIL